MSGEILIQASGVSHSYREAGRRREVLRGLDLEVRRGEAVALLGRSGSGKTTLLNLLAGIDQPDEGEIRVAEHDLTRLGEPGRTLFRRRHLGFVFQFFNLIPTLTLEENVRLPLELIGKRSQGARARARSLLAQIGLADRADDFPDQLSGGEQQRVAIARALAHDPLLVLADEPTGNLDARTGQRVMELLGGLLSPTGRTLVLVTHSPEVARAADRVLTLSEGRLREAGTDPAW